MDAVIAYAQRTGERPRYYANDHARDRVPLDPRVMPLTNGRAAGAMIDREGFALVAHRSTADFSNPACLVHRDEISALVRHLSGADAVIVASPGILRFAEKAALSGQLNNSRPARFVHVDVSDSTAAAFAERAADGRAVKRFAHFNIWRALSVPPQDVPLAVCDARTVQSEDLIAADAIFDESGKPEWSFEGLVVAYNPAHRWHWFPDMTIDEALIFKSHDSDLSAPHCVPHVAFDNSTCPSGAVPRASIEMRAIAFWND
jgi:hypothetical protein